MSRQEPNFWDTEKGRGIAAMYGTGSSDGFADALRERLRNSRGRQETSGHAQDSLPQPCAPRVDCQLTPPLPGEGDEGGKETTVDHPQPVLEVRLARLEAGAQIAEARLEALTASLEALSAVLAQTSIVVEKLAEACSLLVVRVTEAEEA